MKAAVAEVDGVSRVVGATQILAPVSFRVEAGQAVAVSGANGSGKTTLLRILLGRDRPSTGTVMWQGRPRIDSDEVASVMGAAPFYRDLTVGEHLTLVEVSWGGPSETGGFETIVTALRMRRVLNQFPSELSSGERQLSSLALALLRPAKLLVLDEPEQRLDEARRQALERLLIQKVRAGCAVVFATHDDSLREAVAGSTVVLGSADVS